MAYRVEVLRSAARELEALPQPVRRRVTRAIVALSDVPRPHGAVLLSAGDRIWRVRVGDYRILHRIHDDRVLVVVVRIRHRREAYR
jgi:mRNA interferase RelE/StbE